MYFLKLFFLIQKTFLWMYWMMIDRLKPNILPEMNYWRKKWFDGESTPFWVFSMGLAKTISWNHQLLWASMSIIQRNQYFSSIGTLELKKNCISSFRALDFLPNRNNSFRNKPIEILCLVICVQIYQYLYVLFIHMITIVFHLQLAFVFIYKYANCFLYWINDIKKSQFWSNSLL